jgi:hypothetical protein
MLVRRLLPPKNATDHGGSMSYRRPSWAYVLGVASFVIVGAVGSKGVAETPACEVVSTVPAEANPIDGSVLKADASSWKKTFTAGQGAFVTLKNGSAPHITGVKVRFFDTGPDGEKDACVSQVTVVPGKPLTLSHSVFGTSATYNLEVSLAQDVEVALVNVAVKALPKQ